MFDSTSHIISFLLIAPMGNQLLGILLNIYNIIWPDLRKGGTSCKRNFCHFHNHSIISSHYICFWLGSLGLLLLRSNVRSLSKPPVPSSEPPKRDIKQCFQTWLMCALTPPIPRWAWFRILVNVVGWWKNVRVKFHVHSYYGSRDTQRFKTEILSHAIYPSLCRYGLVTKKIASEIERVHQLHIACAGPRPWTGYCHEI